jgi:hypothetical protein
LVTFLSAVHPVLSLRALYERSAEWYAARTELLAFRNVTLPSWAQLFETREKPRGRQVTEDLIDVQYAACYTQGVETTLRQIHDRSEGSVKWLHYGTTEGAYLNYPGFLWPRSCGGSQCGETYDPRSRPWYAQGATGSKNVVIIFDTSGSMSNVRGHTSSLSESVIGAQAARLYTR